MDDLEYINYTEIKLFKNTKIFTNIKRSPYIWKDLVFLLGAYFNNLCFMYSI